jgi:hypothetical protein
MVFVWLGLSAMFAYEAFTSLKSGIVEFSPLVRSERRTRPISYWLFVVFFVAISIACTVFAIDTLRDT